jgi:hypothetical protein
MRNDTTQQIRSALHKTFPAAKFTVQYNGQRISWTDDGPTIEQVHQVILQAACATEGESWDGKPILKLEDGHWICFSRYNIAERAAEQADLARRSETPNEWFLEATGGSRSCGSSKNGYIRLRDRLVAVMQTSCFGEATSLTKLLTANCICCGKGLTDPVSMARTIGPECYGSASVNLPSTFKLETDLPDPASDYATHPNGSLVAL